MDEDLQRMSKDELVKEVKKLRSGIHLILKIYLKVPQDNL